jgi:hypothetical protein
MNDSGRIGISTPCTLKSLVAYTDALHFDDDVNQKYTPFITSDTDINPTNHHLCFFIHDTLSPDVACAKLPYMYIITIATSINMNNDAITNIYEFDDAPFTNGVLPMLLDALPLATDLLDALDAAFDVAFDTDLDFDLPALLPRLDLDPDLDLDLRSLFTPKFFSTDFSIFNIPMFGLSFLLFTHQPHITKCSLPPPPLLPPDPPSVSAPPYLLPLPLASLPVLSLLLAVSECPLLLLLVAASE